MNTEQFKSLIGSNLVKVREKKIEHKEAIKEICNVFTIFAKERNMPADDGVRKRVEDAIKHFLEDVHPTKPGAAIHDAIDHILHG